MTGKNEEVESPNHPKVIEAASASGIQFMMELFGEESIGEDGMLQETLDIVKALSRFMDAFSDLPRLRQTTSEYVF